MLGYCCKGFQPAPNGPDLAKDAKELASNAAEAIAAEVALNTAAKAFCRIAVPALLLPLELIEDAIPIVGMYSGVYVDHFNLLPQPDFHLMRNLNIAN